jgi:AcrR family transcriptional regulator
MTSSYSTPKPEPVRAIRGPLTELRIFPVPSIHKNESLVNNKSQAPLRRDIWRRYQAYAKVSAMQTEQFRNEASLQDKSQRTKALLMDAALALFAERGIEATSVNEITAHAKVANGTFYYHYKDKDEFIDALEHAVATMFVNRVDELMEELTDGAERVATATQQIIYLAAEDAAWGWMIVHAFMNLGRFSASISRGIRKDVALGIEQGNFQLDPTDVAFSILLAVVGAGLKMRLENPTTVGTEVLTSEYVLRMLGLAPDRARALVSRTAARIPKSKHKIKPVRGRRRESPRAKKR